MSRNWNDPLYKTWRNAVRKRDGYKCVLCKTKKKLQVHHIRGWTAFPSLRFVVDNGITICRVCHNKVNGNEHLYQKLFIEMVDLIKRKNNKKSGK